MNASDGTHWENTAAMMPVGRVVTLSRVVRPLARNRCGTSSRPAGRRFFCVECFRVVITVLFTRIGIKGTLETT